MTVIFMLTGYTLCPPENKTTTEIVQAYVDKVHANFEGSSKISLTMGQD